MRISFFIPAFLLFSSSAICQPNRPSNSGEELYKEIARMDSVLFDAFNNQDLDAIRHLFAEDLEFYHDKDGLSSYQQTMESLAGLFQQNMGLRRELVKGSLEVYPVKDYGAIEVGTHTFSHMENGRLVEGTFEFVHVWRKENGRWKVSRVISYGH